MTNKAQTTLTIALTFAVSVLLLDRMIEPAQAQAKECVTPRQLADFLAVATATIVEEIRYRSPEGECATSADLRRVERGVENAVMLWCSK